MLKAAIAHLWFVTIHPFDDGNGRIARAIADWALARSRRPPAAQHVVAKSGASAYYDILSGLQVTLDITDWLRVVSRLSWIAQSRRRRPPGAVFRKAAFWDKHAEATINPRQQKMLNKLFDGFEGQADVNQVGDDRQVLAGYGRA